MRVQMELLSYGVRRTRHLRGIVCLDCAAPWIKFRSLCERLNRDFGKPYKVRRFYKGVAVLH